MNLTLEQAMAQATKGPLSLRYTSAAQAIKKANNGTDGGGADGHLYVGSGLDKEIVAFLPHHRDPKEDGDRGATYALLAHWYNRGPELVEALKFYANEENWKIQESGIGEFPSEAECDGGEKARLALASANTVTIPD